MKSAVCIIILYFDWIFAVAVWPSKGEYPCSHPWCGRRWW